MKPVVLAILVLFAFDAGADDGPSCQHDPAPREAVLAYLGAMKAQRFEDAYDHVTSTMTDGKSREEWAALQRKMFTLGGVTIGELDVRESHRAVKSGNDCEETASVPNVLRASDVLNNQGSTEFEVYTVVKQADGWRVDAQQSLFEEAAIRQWFPNDPIPEFQGTAPADP